MMILTIIILGLLILRYGKNLNFNLHSFHFCILAFIVFCFVSVLWRIDPTRTIEKATTIVQILLCMSVVYVYADKLKSSLPLIDIICWAGYIVTLYLFIVYGWDNLKFLLEESIRIDSGLINSNIIGMITAFSLVLTLYKILFFKFSIWHLFTIPEIAILAVSSSRKAFLIFVIGCLFILLIKYVKRNFLSIVFRGFLVVLLATGIMFILFSFHMFDSMNKRLEGFTNFFTNEDIVDSSSLQRKYYTEIGLRTFLENPFLGIGIGCSNQITLKYTNESTYLHNNYVELLACGGLVGTFIYYFMFFLPGIFLFQYRYNSDSNNLICLMLLILYLFLSFAYVSYYSKETYFFLLLFFIQAKINQNGSFNVLQN
jgi:O-antigen ligase